jgi:acetate kinase
MRKLRADGSEDAQRAIAQFTNRVVRDIGSMTASLDGLDLLAFSGGIGENDTALREQVCARLSWMGVRMDAQRNQQASGQSAASAIHASDSPVQVWVVPTDEGRVAARETAALLRTKTAATG